jgi:hypothetical protein
MSNETPKAEGDCPVNTGLEIANKTAKAEFGANTAAAGGNKRVSTSVTISTAVTENSKTKTSTVETGVTIGVKTTEEDVEEHDECCK